jgi:hypothetical protein
MRTPARRVLPALVLLGLIGPTAVCRANDFTAAPGSPIAMGGVSCSGNPTQPCGNPYDVAVGDLGRDGIPDLAAVTGPGSLLAFTGFGDGTFTGQSFSAQNQVVALGLGDFNRDHFPDVAVLRDSAGGGTVSVFFSNGSGGFAPVFAAAVGSSPRGLAVTDLNRDGKLDIVATAGSALHVELGTGTSSPPFQLVANYTAGGGAAGVASGDFDDDGDTDIAVANSAVPATGNTVMIFHGDGTGALAAGPQYSGSTARSVVAADFDRDGVDELAVGDGTVRFMREDTQATPATIVAGAPLGANA